MFCTNVLFVFVCVPDYYCLLDHFFLWTPSWRGGRRSSQQLSIYPSSAGSCSMFSSTCVLLVQTLQGGSWTVQASCTSHTHTHTPRRVRRVQSHCRHGGGQSDWWDTQQPRRRWNCISQRALSVEGTIHSYASWHAMFELVCIRCERHVWHLRKGRSFGIFSWTNGTDSILSHRFTMWLWKHKARCFKDAILSIKWISAMWPLTDETDYMYQHLIWCFSSVCVAVGFIPWISSIG